MKEIKFRKMGLKGDKNRLLADKKFNILKMFLSY
jgi:hypothetical protein